MSYSFGDDVIDSRDIIEKLDELKSMVESDDVEDWLTTKEVAEYELLKSVCEEGEQNFSGWNGGTTLVHVNYFEDYAREWFQGTHDRTVDFTSWPFSCIDWSDAADELMNDFTEINLDGEEYYGLS